MRFIVLTGTSGAGKMAAFNHFADVGYYAVDNLPAHLLPELARSCRDAEMDRVLVVVDARSGPSVSDLPDVLDELVSEGFSPELIFLDASDEVLVRRFKETRRPHPIFRDGVGSILDAVQTERAMLDGVLTRADRVVDTSKFAPIDLKDALAAVTGEQAGPRLIIVVESFGFKHGVPLDADLVFDVRFLCNPHYIPELKRLTGRDPGVVEYIDRDPRSAEYLEQLYRFIDYLLPHYEREGKAYLTIAIGCTGGHHRSVVVADRLNGHLTDLGYKVMLFHRDIEVESASREYTG